LSAVTADDLADQLRQMLAPCSDWLWRDLGPQLSCCEAKAFAAVPGRLGLFEERDALISSHACSDEIGDEHWQTDAFRRDPPGPERSN
jgi:hypothetical protein